MKSRLDYKSKRIAIIVVIAIILFAIASISTYFFIKGNADTQAAKLDNMAANEQNSAQEQRTEGTTATPQSEANQTETTEQVNNDQETEETTQQINTQTTNVGVNPQTTTTDTGVQENITTRTETQVVENTNILLGFTQQALKMDVNAVSNLNGNMPNIKKEIVAVTKTNLNGILNGDEITYEIKITNESTDILEQINASAVIPEGTELVEGSISDEGVVENGKIIWKIDVDQEKTIYFTVKVLATEGIISANAVIEGKETEVVQTPILKATLAVDKTEVSKNETLTYTVSIENTANISAQMKVEAVIPENTQLETEGLNVKDKTISWDKTLAALEKAEYSYTVKVNKYEKDYNIENAVKVNGFETNKVSSRIIDIIPPEIIVKEESIGKDPYFSEVSFKLHDDNLVDKIIINGTERDLSDNAWSDANYQNIKDLLHEGENTIVLVDVAGNKTEKKFIMDWTAPEIIVKEESIGKDPYFSEVSFKLHDNNLVDKIIINGTERDLSDNAWSDANYQNIKDLLHEGENTIVLVDVAGNKTEKKFTMDWTAPTITVKEESKGKDPYFSEVSFKLYDNNLVDKIIINGTERDLSDNAWSDANYQNIKDLLHEGKNTIVLVDVAGNKTEKKFIMDWTAPEIIVKEESIGKDPYFSEVSFKLHDDNLVDKIIINGTERDLNDNAWSDANYQNIKDLLHEGENTIVLVDVAGNKTEKKFTIDWTAPEIIVKEESKGKDPYFSEVSFKLYDNNKVDKYLVNNKEFDVGDAKWSDANYATFKSALKEGENTIILVDVAGNKVEKKFIIDWTPATITVKEESKGKDPYFSEVSFKLYDNNKVDKYLINDKEFDVGDAKWGDANYATFESVLKEGENTIVLIDIAGNRTEKKFIMDWTAPTIKINGEKEITLEAGSDTYKELGATVIDNFDATIDNLQPDLIHYYTYNKETEKYTFSTKVDCVDTSKVGLYKVSYTYTDVAENKGVNADNKNSTSVIRFVYVVDTTAPVIKLNGEKEITLEAGIDTYRELGATVTDNVDATIDNLQPDLIHYYIYNNETGKYVFSTKVDCVDTSKVGLYKVSYTYTDEAGNKGVNADNKNSTSIIRFVYVVDTTAPTIELNGDKNITLEAGIDTYEEKGATVRDNVDATIDNLQPAYINYSVDGKFVGEVDAVDTTKVGTYKVVYEYTDAAGNKGVDASDTRHEYVIRVVTVQDTTVPTIELNGDKNITLEAGIDTYEEKGATVRDNVDATIDNLQPAYINYSVDGKFVGEVDAVDTTKVGTYKVVYEYTDAAGNKGVDASDTRHEYVIRIVTVQDTTKPLLKLNGDKKITLEAGIDTYEELGTTMIDNVDPVITNLQPAYINYSVDGRFVGKVDAVETTKVGTYKVVYEYTDAAGNKGIDALDLRHEYVMRTVIVQDTIAPTATVEYSTTELTNRAVMVTLTASEPITLDESAGTWIDKGNNVYQKSYPVNNEQEIKFKDLAGNEGSVTVKITNIDKVAPTATVEYSTTEITNKLFVTVKFSEKINEETLPQGFYAVDGEENTYKKAYYSNKDYSFTVKDLAGNEGLVNFTITNIDRVAPTAEVSFDTTEPTNKLFVTVKFSEKINEETLPQGFYAVDGEENTYKKAYYSNKDYSFTVKDLAGNEGLVNFTITNIDRVAPTAEVSFDTTEPTNKLFVTVKFSEKINEETLPQGFYAVDGEENTYKKAYYSNKEYSFTVKDIAGNEGNVMFEITNIQ